MSIIQRFHCNSAEVSPFLSSSKGSRRVVSSAALHSHRAELSSLSKTLHVLLTHCLPVKVRAVVAFRIERLDTGGKISDKERGVSIMYQEVLLVLPTQVTPPLRQREERR